MRKLKAGVIGVGYLGKFHAEKYHLSQNADLIGVYDKNHEQAKNISAQYDCQAFDDLNSLLDNVDAVSIVAPTPLHFSITEQVLNKGVHCLVEKPFTDNLEDAEKLISLKNQLKLKVQVGHLERFNPAFVKVLPLLSNPLYIEAYRLSPYIPRSVDSSVLLDLMIHDVDLILKACNSPIVNIEAKGFKVLSETIDIAMLRLFFKNGCIADIKSGRLSQNPERKIRIFQAKGYFSVDFMNYVCKYCVTKPSPDSKIELDYNQESFQKEDLIFKEIESFVSCILDDTEPLITAEEATYALKVVLEANSKIF